MSKCRVCGCETAEGVKPRSIDQIRRYFALIRAAYHHWPEAHVRQFSSEEECRAFVQMKAGAREVGAQIPLTGMSKERAILLAEAAIRGSGSYAIPTMHGDVLVIWRPKSISFSKMSHDAFCRLSDDVEAVIEAETGMRADDLLREAA